uniref:Uncharacterized protein n=1 Tax=viral metagenome TaxID=1070528 RepID=A0A6M3L013_9ZZZZ
MKKETLEKYKKLVDDICSDDSGADMPYDDFLKKWALKLYSIILNDREETFKKILKQLRN